MPAPSVVTGIAALALLGTGFVMIARRLETVSAVTA